MVRPAAGSVRRVAVQPRRRARGLARNRAVPKLADAISAKGLAGAALPVRVAAVAPDSGAPLVAVLVAALAGGGEDGVSCASAFVASSVCAVLSGGGNSVLVRTRCQDEEGDLYTPGGLT